MKNKTENLHSQTTYLYRGQNLEQKIYLDAVWMYRKSPGNQMFNYHLFQENFLYLLTPDIPSEALANFNQEQENSSERKIVLNIQDIVKNKVSILEKYMC